MQRDLRRTSFGLLLAAATAGCSPPGVSVPFTEPAAAVVDGHTITLKAYQARLQVSQHRDPFLGIPEAVPSPAPSQRLEDFTIEQLVREQVAELEAARRGISISNQALDARINVLKAKAGATAFVAALERNGFSESSFKSYQSALLAEVGLIQAIARERAASAASELKSGTSFASVAAKWSDDSGTSSRNGEVGWLRPTEIPEAQLARAVEALATGAISPIIRTNRGLTIATVLNRRSDQVQLAVILVLAPSVDLLSPQTTPSWFTKLIDDRESQLRRDGKIVVKVGSRASS